MGRRKTLGTRLRATGESMEAEVKPCVYEADKLSQVGRDEAEVINQSSKKIGQHWTILYPRKKDQNLLLDSYSIALKRLEATARRLRPNSDQAKAYDE